MSMIHVSLYCAGGQTPFGDQGANLDAVCDYSCSHSRTTRFMEYVRMRALGSSPCVGGWVVVRRAELFKLGEPFFRSTFRYPFFVVGTSSAV